MLNIFSLAIKDNKSFQLFNIACAKYMKIHSNLITKITIFIISHFLGLNLIQRNTKYYLTVKVRFIIAFSIIVHNESIEHDSMRPVFCYNSGQTKSKASRQPSSPKIKMLKEVHSYDFMLNESFLKGQKVLGLCFCTLLVYCNSCIRTLEEMR